MDEDKLVGSAIVGDWIGLTARRVGQLVKEGVLENAGDARSMRFDLKKTVRKYIEHLRAGFDGKEDAETVNLVKLKADADYKRAKADEAMIALAELEGKMHRAEDVEEVVGQMVAAIRAGLLSLPGRCAMDTAAADTAEETAGIIKREVYSLLEELSNYEYRKSDYTKLVRKRRGKSGDGGET